MNWIAIGLFFKIFFMKAPHGDEGKLVKEKIRVQKIGQLPSVINESSGIAYDSSRSVFYSINDSGGESIVYVTDTLFKLVDSISLKSIRNKDWEEILYYNDTLVIGDFGNNKNTRKNLMVYEYAIIDSALHSIPYSYNNQSQFPPDTMDFDCEAFGYVDGDYYLFSKNRSNNNVHLYKLVTEKGLAEIQLDLPIKGMVTAAAVIKQSDSIYKWAILTYGIIYFVEQKHDRNASKWMVYSYKKIGYTGQAEAITWINKKQFVITNERGLIWKFSFKK